MASRLPVNLTASCRARRQTADETMRYAVEFKHFEPTDAVRKLVGNLISRIDKKTKGLAPVFLKFMIEEIPPHTLYTVSITLDVPGKTIAAKDQAHVAEHCIRAVFTQIERQLDAYKADLRGEQWWKRFTRREKLRRQKIGAPAAEQSSQESFFSIVNPHVSKLNDFVRHVVAFAEARGDLVPGELTPEDVVDAALIEAYVEFVRNPIRGEIRSWLIRHATKVLEREIKRSNAERRRMVHIEEDIPETPPAEAVSTLGDEILDFYQPDEDLKMEDIIPDIEVPTPEEEAETSELRRCVKAAVNSMPKDWRRALMLHYVQELKVPELAKMMEKREPEVDRLLANAREFLRQKLIASGCSVKGASRKRGHAAGVASKQR